MTVKKIALKRDNLTYSRIAKQEEQLLKKFFKMLAASKKMFIIQNRSHTGQYSGNEIDHLLPNKPEKVYANGAWIGFKFGKIFYRTDLIAHKTAFILWLKENLNATKNFFLEMSEPLKCPKHIHFFSSTTN